MRARIALLTLACCLPAVAQSPVVLPDASYATSLGNANNSIPFSWTPTRYQQLFDNADVGTPNLLRYMQLRPASGYGTPTRGGHMVRLELRLGTTTFNWNTATNDFAMNNPNPTVVLRPTWVQLPVLRPESPADWQITIPFDQIWPWPGVNNLCVEVVNWGNTNNNALFSYPLDATNAAGLAKTCRMYASGNPTALTGTGPSSNYGLIMRFGMALTNNEGFFQNYGPECASSAGAMIHGLKQVPRIGSTLDAMLYGAPSGAGALFIVGLSSGQWGPFQLPFDMTPFGAPGCALNAAMVASSLAQVGGNGQGTVALAVPNANTLLGASIYTQWLVVDQPANALGLVTTTGARWVLGL